MRSGGEHSRTTRTCSSYRTALTAHSTAYGVLRTWMLLTPYDCCSSTSWENNSPILRHRTPGKSAKIRARRLQHTEYPSVSIRYTHAHMGSASPASLISLEAEGQHTSAWSKIRNTINRLGALQNPSPWLLIGSVRKRMENGLRERCPYSGPRDCTSKTGCPRAVASTEVLQRAPDSL